MCMSYTKGIVRANQINQVVNQPNKHSTIEPSTRQSQKQVPERTSWWLRSHIHSGSENESQLSVNGLI